MALGQGPLAGIRVVELAGVGPGPLAAMLLADLGATVIRVDRKQPSGLGVPRPPRFDLALRNRDSIRVDLKDPAAVELVLDLIAGADALIEGFRPGVTERLGLGPDVCLARNPVLVYGRVTGWGQDGPLAQNAGHDVNYIALTGLLDAVGRAGQPPTIPLNVVGDYAGGALMLAFGLLAGVLEARQSGRGQVVDAAMVDGASTLMTVLYGLRWAGMHNGPRGTNFLDSGAPWYEVYACADGLHVAVGAIEEKFYLQLLQLLDLDTPAMRRQRDRASWPTIRQNLADRFLSRNRDAWVALLAGTDVCLSPVLTMEEAPTHPHMRARGSFVELDGVMHPAPSPRFSRTPAATPRPHSAPSAEGARAALTAWLPEDRVDALFAAGTVV